MSLLNLLQYCFCFIVLVLWLPGMWDLRSLTRDRTHSPWTKRWSLNHWTTREVWDVFWEWNNPDKYIVTSFSLCLLSFLFFLLSSFPCPPPPLLHLPHLSFFPCSFFSPFPSPSFSFSLTDTMNICNLYIWIIRQAHFTDYTINSVFAKTSPSLIWMENS